MCRIGLEFRMTMISWRNRLKVIRKNIKVRKMLYLRRNQMWESTAEIKLNQSEPE